MNKLIRILILAATGFVPAFAQLTTTSTTLSGAINAPANGASTGQWCVASATGITVPSIATAGTYLFGGKEAVQVASAGASATCFNVKRGQLGTSSQIAHASGETVWVGNVAGGSGSSSAPFTGGVIVNITPSGYCVATQQYSLPVIVSGVSSQVYQLAGNTFNCIANQWTNTTPSSQEILTGSTPIAATSPAAAADVSDRTGGVGGAQSATTGNGATGGAIVDIGGAGGAAGTSSGTGGTGGRVAQTGGAGGGTVTGGVGGAVTFTGGAGAAGTTAGGVGGAATVVGGVGGAGPTPAAGGATAVTAGAGGAQSATTSNGATGGAETLTAGAGGAGGSVSGTGGTGGALSAIAGAGGGTITGGTGGALALGAGVGGAGSTAGGTGGALNLYSGAAGSGGTGTSGGISLRTGGAAGTAVVGTTTAGATTVNSAGTNQTLTLFGSGSGKVTLADGTDTTKKVVIDPSGSTTGTAVTLAAAQAGNVTVTLPINTGALTNAYFCGATSGTTTCPNTATGGTARVIGGIATLASNTAVISAISPAFTSTSTFSCVGNDITTRANPVQVVQTSSSSITITNTTGASDVINWFCYGN